MRRHHDSCAACVNEFKQFDDLGRQGAPKACATSTVTPVRIPAAEEEHLGAILVKGRGPLTTGAQELSAVS